MGAAGRVYGGKEHDQDCIFDKPLCCGVDNRLEAGKTRISRWSYEAAAVIQAGYDKVLSKLNNGLQLPRAYYVPAKLCIKHSQTSHFILIAPLLL